MSTSRRPTTPEDWLRAIHDAFADDSDRSAGIVAGAMLDDALKLLLEKKLVPPVSADRSLLQGPNAPLGTFSAKIDACHQLGLISRHLARDLHLIRKIRNEFAHRALDCSFTTQPIGDWVRILDSASDMNRRNPAAREAAGPPGPRWNFLAIVSWILYSLHRDVSEAASLPEHGPEFGYIDWTQLPEQLRRLIDESGATSP